MTFTNPSIEVSYKIVSPHFRTEYLPHYASHGAAGMDLHAAIPDKVELQPGQRERIGTGIAIQLPDAFTVGLVYARSGLAWRKGVALPNGVGVIDSDYTGELQVLLCNFSTDVVSIEPGDRIAQIVFAPLYLATLCEVDEFRPTERGEQGFGSTGIRPI